jgi:hypothetical protein
MWKMLYGVDTDMAVSIVLHIEIFYVILILLKLSNMKVLSNVLGDPLTTLIMAPFFMLLSFLNKEI